MGQVPAPANTTHTDNYKPRGSYYCILGPPPAADTGTWNPLTRNNRSIQCSPGRRGFGGWIADGRMTSSLEVVVGGLFAAAVSCFLFFQTPISVLPLMRKVTVTPKLETQIRKLLPVGSLVWVVRNGTRHYQEMVLDIMVLPEGILVVSTTTVTIVSPKPQRIRAYLSASGVFRSGANSKLPKTLQDLPVVYRSYFRAPQPPRSGTTLSFEDVVFMTT